MALSERLKSTRNDKLSLSTTYEKAVLANQLYQKAVISIHKLHKLSNSSKLLPKTKTDRNSLKVNDNITSFQLPPVIILHSIIQNGTCRRKMIFNLNKQPDDDRNPFTDEFRHNSTSNDEEITCRQFIGNKMIM